jgi:hypothetical protein
VFYSERKLILPSARSCWVRNGLPVYGIASFDQLCHGMWCLRFWFVHLPINDYWGIIFLPLGGFYLSSREVLTKNGLDLLFCKDFGTSAFLAVLVARLMTGLWHKRLSLCLSVFLCFPPSPLRRTVSLKSFLPRFNYIRRSTSSLVVDLYWSFVGGWSHVDRGLLLFPR